MKDLIEHYFDRLWPINRSLTGNGNRKTLKILSELVDLNIIEVPSGTQCFDWIVPPEWNVKDAWVKTSKGQKIIDFKANNLHLMSYSIPFSGIISLDQLKQHLFSLPDRPSAIPYKTSYYNRSWGFCLSHDQLINLKDDQYKVFIDSTIDEKGSMTIGEAVLHGETDKEVLFSTYICHPSLANNELSGPLVTSFIFNELKKVKNRKYTYRFLFIPETIGSIYYLSQFGEHLKEKTIAGFVVTCVGDAGSFTYKKSKKGDCLTDRATELVLAQCEEKYILDNYFPYGSDERQYCSIAFNLPIGSLMRTRYGKYPQYHTSDDNKDLISFVSMEITIKQYLDIINVIENNAFYLNLFPFCEVQLQKRGLYPEFKPGVNIHDSLYPILWILNLSDGASDLIDIANQSKMPFKRLVETIEILLEKNVIAKSEK